MGVSFYKKQTIKQMETITINKNDFKAFRGLFTSVRYLSSKIVKNDSERVVLAIENNNLNPFTLAQTEKIKNEKDWYIICIEYAKQFGLDVQKVSDLLLTFKFEGEYFFNMLFEVQSVKDGFTNRIFYKETKEFL